MYEKCPHCGRISAADRWKPRAKTETVIIVEFLEGDGTCENIARVARAVYTLDGKPIGIIDPDAINGRLPMDTERKDAESPTS